MRTGLIYLVLVFAYNLSFAQVPQTLSYQGLLTDPSGTPVADASYNVTFNFYTVSTGGSVVQSRTVNGITTYQGLFTTIIGNSQGGSSNPPLNNLSPALGATQYYVGVQVNNGAELVPRVALTAVPYAFAASTIDPSSTIPGPQIGSGINASNITSGTLNGSLVGSGVSVSNISGILPGSQIGSGINATNVTIGTLNGSLVGSGVSAANISGLLPGTQVGTGISASNITTGTLSGTLIGTGANGIDAGKISSGTLDGSKVAITNINASNINSGTIAASLLPGGNTGVPIGTIVAWGGATPPTGWLICDGSSLATGSYPGLYAVLGNLWGQPDGSHFNIPNFQGYFLRGWDNAAGNDPDASSRTSSGKTGASANGNAVGTYQSDQTKAHTHSATISTTGGYVSLSGGSGAQYVNDNSFAGAVGSTGGNETRPKNVYVNYIIKTQ